MAGSRLAVLFAVMLMVAASPSILFAVLPLAGRDVRGRKPVLVPGQRLVWGRRG